MLDQDRREHMRQRWEHEGLITAVAFGGFLITIGVVFAITPNLFDRITAFFQDITSRQLPSSGDLGTLFLPAPQNPAAHSELYTAVMQFDVGIAVLQLIILGMRLGLQSKVHRVAETVGNLVFWGGAAFLVNTFLQAGMLRSWFEYWATLIVLVGVSLICRAIAHFVIRH